MKKGLIYLHKHKKSGKCYVGSTTQSVKRRWRKSDTTYTSYINSTVFYNALKKYTWDGFETSILEEDIPFEDISKREEYYIKEYNSLVPNGFNIVNIIEGRNKCSEETKRKISKKRKDYFSLLTEPVIAPNKHHHIFKDGIEYKKCSRCQDNKILTDFGKYRISWDRLNRYCKECHKLNARERREKVPDKILTKEQLKLSYKMRKTISRPFIGKDKDGNTIRFKSGMEASRNGYDKTQIRRSILKKKEYMKYTWEYEDDEKYTKINARECEIKQILVEEEREFLDKYHKQKYCYSKICYSLYYNNKLMLVMSFGKPRFNKNYEWEIIRLCTKKNHIVMGGASKLFSRFLKDHKPNNIITYADNEYSNSGKVYEILGFKLEGQSQNGYSYRKGNITLPRYKCQKHKLHKILGESFDPNKTEKRNMLDNGWERIEISSNKIYIWSKSPENNQSLI